MTNLSILQHVGATDIELAPYPYVVVENCLPEPLYEALEKTRPSDDYLVDGRSFHSNQRLDLHARQLLARKDLSSYWREFIKYHLSDDFWHEIIRVFDLDHQAQRAVKQLGSLRTIPAVMRSDKPSGKAISMDVNVGVNTPVVGDATRVRGPHVDNPIELFAAMLYMPPKDAEDEGGDFVVYAKTRPVVRFEGKAEVRQDEEKTLIEHARVKYERNTMVAFINSIDAIHGVTKRQSTHFRRLVNFCAELPFAAFTIPR